MNGLWEALDADFAAALLVVLVKAAALLLAAELATRWLSRSSAAVRHLIWAAAVVGVLALPLLTPLVPALPVPVLAAAPVAAADGVSRPVTPEAGPPATEPRMLIPLQQMIQPSYHGPSYLARGLGLAWLTGVVLLAARLACGIISARRMVRQGRPASRRIQRENDAVAALLDMAAMPVRMHDAADVPMAWGVFHPTVVLPPEADGWSTQRRRLVLVHEMAHIKRGDCLSQLAAHATCAVHWVNPLAWRAAMRLRTERELACDDVVIRTGARGSEYARHLLEIARRARGDWAAHVVSLPMARPSQLEGRLLALLSAGKSRRNLDRSWHVAVALSTLVLILPLAAFQPWASPSTPPETAVQTGAGQEGGIETPSDATRARVAAAMVTALSDDDAEIRATAAHALGMMEDVGHVDALVATLTDVDSDVRSEAAWALGMIESPEAVPALVGALTDERVKVRRQVVWALGMIESESALDGLLDAMKDADRGVQREAMEAIARIAG